MKKLSTLFLSMLMATGISISAQGTADFETLNSGKVGSSYGSYSTTAGWSVTNSQANKNALWNADELTPILNGGNPTGGTITSPTLTGGIGKLTFKYGYPFKDEKGYKAKIDIKQNGEVVKTETLTNASTSYGTAYSYTSADFNLAGDFEIVITNLCPQQAAKKDRLAIWDLSWTGYTAGGDDPDPEPTYWVKFDTEGQEAWAAPQIWAWDGDGDFYSSWPGEDMEATDESNIFIKSFEKMPTGIIISCNNGNTKAWNGNIDGSNLINHATYTSTAGVDEEGNPIGAKDVTVYFDNRESKWASVYCYLESQSTGGWPGGEMTLADGKKYIYQVTFKNTEGFIIFNNNGDMQTENIEKYEDGHIYSCLEYMNSTDLGVYDPANFPEEGGDDPDPEVDHWYLVGAATNWGLDESKELTAVDDAENVFSITLPSLEGEWKIWNGAWGNAGGKAFGPGSETSAASGVALEVWCNGMSNDNFNFPIKPETEVTITLTIPEGAAVGGSSVAAQLVVDYTAAEETLLIPETLGVLSTPWNNGITVTEMTYDEATNTFSIDNYTVGEDVPSENALADEPSTLKDGYVQFGVNTAATTWDELNNAHRYGAEVEGTTLDFTAGETEVPVKHFATNPGSCNGFKLAPGNYDLAVKFDPENKAITLKAKVTPTGVENVSIDADNEADAEYFNLQGVKVAEPSNGIFIRRANGKSTKVFVK